uniref:NADH dehydrogenase subunit 2 n=1 Tax=Apogonia cf. basalis TaxID=2962665 RepID=UPI00211471E4|nr:NADH dehydrogenase subunit 2 [Apogonia cf. basalis]UTE83838.1 NADH dehydrogenase subunit 2 [Apogonia cf. basalis]
MYYKSMFLILLIMSSLISISSFSWMSMWMGLEMNLLSFIPLMTPNKNMMSAEAAIKYFITQAMASTIMLFSIIIMSLKFMYNFNMNFYLILMLNTSLFTKMGAAPFHFWLPEIISGLNWFNSFIILTWQKITPMILFMYFTYNILYTSIIVITSMMISGIMGINQTSLQKILTYSSINHIGWMLSSMLINEIIWLYYFMTYLLITFNISMIFKIFNIFNTNQLTMSFNNFPLIKMMFIMNFMSLGGLPPFMGFIPKWLTIQSLILKNLTTITLIMTILTLLTTYFYMQITFSNILLQINKMLFYTHSLTSHYFLWLINLIILIGTEFSTLMFNFI